MHVCMCRIYVKGRKQEEAHGPHVDRREEAQGPGAHVYDQGPGAHVHDQGATSLEAGVGAEKEAGGDGAGSRAVGVGEAWLCCGMSQSVSLITQQLCDTDDCVGGQSQAKAPVLLRIVQDAGQLAGGGEADSS